MTRANHVEIKKRMHTQRLDAIKKSNFDDIFINNIIAALLFVLQSFYKVVAYAFLMPS